MSSTVTLSMRNTMGTPFLAGRAMVTVLRRTRPVLRLRMMRAAAGFRPLLGHHSASLTPSVGFDPYSVVLVRVTLRNVLRLPGDVGPMVHMDSIAALHQVLQAHAGVAAYTTCMNGLTCLVLVAMLPARLIPTRTAHTRLLTSPVTQVHFGPVTEVALPPARGHVCQHVVTCEGSVARLQENNDGFLV
jgi:hypothetical protein